MPHDLTMAEKVRRVDEVNDALAKLVVGALRSAINDHGPIDQRRVLSATKRIVGQLRGAAFNEVVDLGRGGYIERRLLGKMRKLQHGHQILIERHERLRVTCDRLRDALTEVERHCPCGARPESMDTHPHVTGCPVARGLYSATTDAATTDAHRTLGAE